MKKCFIILILLFILGCATTTYTHPTKNDRDFEREKYDCIQIAEQHSANVGAAWNPFMTRSEVEKCLQLKYGWRKYNN